MKKFLKSKIVWLIVMHLLTISFLSARMMEGEDDSSHKSLDLSNWHNVGNIWLRVSNYGFFGAGSNATPSWPSLEYPGGSGIDYLYQGALWFGAKKERKDANGRKLYWRYWPLIDNNDVITEDDPDYIPNVSRAVVDTLVTVGFDGDKSLFEFLPAYWPKEMNTPGYTANNPLDRVLTQSTRTQRRGFDDDGDGLIDEDQVGFTFPFRKISGSDPGARPDNLPSVFSSFDGRFIHEVGAAGTEIIESNARIWYPLGFMDLSYQDPTYTYNFAAPKDDDLDGLIDEDGAPVSEQDFISYYYDYSPFNPPTPGQRTYGSSASTNTHYPLKVRVRQMSYQWSFDYIKNLIYVEFNITNMNDNDILYDCVMGIYMDCDIGPQSLGGSAIATNDKSGYVSGEGYEFAYSRDASGDGLANGLIGARVCTPDPDELEFACWYWEVGKGPDDFNPYGYDSANQPLGTRKTANEKYWLLSGRNPDAQKFDSLREKAESHVTGPNWYEESDAKDTRFLFGFYGLNQYATGPNAVSDPINGYTHPDDERVWNLKPFETMKIVVAVFPGENIEDLKTSASWAKTIYKDAQTLTTVVLPDTMAHYEPPEPPEYPRMFAEMKERGTFIDMDIFWENRSEFSMDEMIIETGTEGWFPGSTYDSDPDFASYGPYQSMDQIPIQFQLDSNPIVPNAKVNPYTAWRLKHDFQGYSIFGRSGRGDRDSWMLIDKWDKIDSDLDYQDYDTNIHSPEVYVDLGGQTGYDTKLPNETIITDMTLLENDGLFEGYYMQDIDYTLIPIVERFERDGIVFIYGYPLYKIISLTKAKEKAYDQPIGTYLTDAQKEHNQLIYMHPALYDIYPNNPAKAEELFLALVDDTVIPLPGHLGQNKIIDPDTETPENIADRLARRYYRSEITNIPKGREYYVAVSAFDRGMASKFLDALESGKDANMRVYFPGPLAKSDMDNIYVVPNPYRGKSSFDGVVSGDTIGDKSRRLWFVNLPMRCNVQIYTLAGDLVDEFEHQGRDNPYNIHDIISISKETHQAIAASGIHPWNLLSKNNQVVASGLYFFSVKNHDTGDVKVGKFAIIR